MPTILTIKGLRFYFWSREHEPIHIHVEGGGDYAKIKLLGFAKKKKNCLSGNGKVTSMTKDKIKGELKIEDAKVKISVYLDGDVLVGIRERAKEEGMKYQPYINKVLRAHLLEEPELAKIQAKLLDMDELVQRVEALEKKSVG